MTRLIHAFVSLFLLASLATGSLHGEGNLLKNEAGAIVRLTGVNWFGMETSNMCPHGLWARDWKGMLMQVKGMGFNCLRLPFCDAMLRDGAKPSSINFYGVDPFRKNGATEMNRELAGKSPVEVLDIIIAGCKELGLAVVLDNHSREPDGYMNEQVWYMAKTPEQQWIDDWTFLAKRYKNSAVVGCDLDNEPHGKSGSGGSQWGGDAAHDWKSAAERCGNAILAANPDLLIIVEGVEQFGATNYWWGGNLRGVRTNPITLTDNTKLVYSPHDYGPEVFAQAWFDDPAFPANLPAVWDSAFAFIKNENKGHLFLGEFGIRDKGSYNGKAGVWFSTILSTLCKSISWTFWCLNPNSGDTGGLLGNDWTTPEQWKLDLLAPCMAPPVFSATAIERRVERVTSNDRITVRKDGIIYKNHALNHYYATLSTLSGKSVRTVYGLDESILSIKGIARGTYYYTVRSDAGKVLASKIIPVF
jgi:endoglucanase